MNRSVMDDWIADNWEAYLGHLAFCVEFKRRLEPLSPKERQRERARDWYRRNKSALADAYRSKKLTEAGLDPDDPRDAQIYELEKEKAKCDNEAKKWEAQPHKDPERDKWARCKKRSNDLADQIWSLKKEKEQEVESAQTNR